jgi:methyl-accepting chemotaxis protein
MPARHLSSLSIRVKLLASFGIVVALMAALGVVAVMRMQDQNAHVTRLADKVVPATDIVGRASAAMNKYRKDELHYVLATPANRLPGPNGVSTDLAGDLRTMSGLLHDYRARGLIADATDARLLTTFETDFNDYVAKTAGFRALADRGRVAAAGAMIGSGPGDNAYSTLKVADAAWENYKGTNVTAAAASSRSAYHSGRAWIIGLLVLALLVAITVALLLSGYLASGLRGMAEAATRISRGEIDQHVDVRSADELGAMGTAFNDMTDYLRETAGLAQAVAGGNLSGEVCPKSENDALGNALAEMTRGLRQMVGSIDEASGLMNDSTHQIALNSDSAGRAAAEVSTAIEHVASGNERQLASISEALRVAEQLAGAAESGAGIARHSAEAVQHARTLAQGGEEAVTRAADTMATVRESSEAATAAIAALGEKSTEIGGIIGAITSIAEQTNLLALNAAIEAARAGESGRGFAVVAEEVRKLAEQSQDAAQSISALIGQIQSETAATVKVVQSGTEHSIESVHVVDVARESFLALGRSVGDMSERVEEISAVVQQIAAGAQLVHESMSAAVSVAEESSAIAQQVAASAQETSASREVFSSSASELARSADGLSELVGRFRLAGPAQSTQTGD